MEESNRSDGEKVSAYTLQGSITASLPTLISALAPHGGVEESDQKTGRRNRSLVGKTG